MNMRLFSFLVGICICIMLLFMQNSLRSMSGLAQVNLENEIKKLEEAINGEFIIFLKPVAQDLVEAGGRDYIYNYMFGAMSNDAQLGYKNNNVWNQQKKDAVFAQRDSKLPINNRVPGGFLGFGQNAPFTNYAAWFAGAHQYLKNRGAAKYLQYFGSEALFFVYLSYDYIQNFVQRAQAAIAHLNQSGATLQGSHWEGAIADLITQVQLTLFGRRL